MDGRSWGPQVEGLIVAGVATIVGGADGEDPVLIVVYSATGVGDGDDVEELLGDVGGDGYLSALRSSPR